MPEKYSPSNPFAPKSKFSDVTNSASTTAPQNAGYSANNPFAQKKKSRAGGFLAPVAQGLTLGASDEILGAIKGANEALPKGWLGSEGTGFSAGYERGKEKVRNVGKEYSDAHPVLSPTLELASGIVAPGFGAAKFAGKGVSLAGKLGRSALAGSAIGAGSGAAYSKEGDRAEGATGGAIVGGVLGSAVPLVGAAGGQVLNQLGARSAKGIDRQALLKLAEAARRDGKTVSDLVAEGKGFGSKPAIVADLLGENGLGLTRAVAGVPGRGKQSLAETLHTRQEGQLGRLMGDIEKRIGIQGRDIHDVAQELVTKTKTDAEPLYAAARPLPINDPKTQQEIVGLLELPEFKAAWKRAARIAAVERNPMQGNGPITVGDVDYMKRGLDAVIESRAGGKNAISRTEARGLRNRLNELLDMVDGEHPEYKTARQTFAGDKAMEDALVSGTEFLKEAHQVTAKQLARMTPGEQEMYRIGAMGALRQVMDNTPENMDKLRRIFATPEAKARLSALLGDDVQFSGLTDDMAREGQMVRTNNGALVGSRTAPMAMEMGDLFQTAANAATGNFDGLAKQGLKALLSNRARIGSEKIANSLSDKLQTRPGTPEFQSLMDALARLQVANRNPSKLRLRP